MNRPDYILIGAMKCGTSTVAKQLELQEGVFMTTPKEPNYFSDDEIFAKGPEWYGALFATAAAADLKGEASTHYTKLPTYPETLTRLQAALPGHLKLIYMIRNPMQRAVSHYIHEWSEGRLGADADAAFKQSPEIIDYGRYGMQIAPFIDAYGAKNVHLTSLEQIKKDPDAEFSRICDFIGAPVTSHWIHDLPAQNVSKERVRKLPMQDLILDNPVAQTLRRTLVPKAVRTWVRERRSMQARPELPADLANHMETVFAKDRAVLAAFFPEHPALDMCYPFATS